MTNYTNVPKANEQSETCTLLDFLSETLSSAKTILRATDSKKNSYIIAKIQYSSHDQTS